MLNTDRECTGVRCFGNVHARDNAEKRRTHFVAPWVYFAPCRVFFALILEIRTSILTGKSIYRKKEELYIHHFFFVSLRI